MGGASGTHHGATRSFVGVGNRPIDQDADDTQRDTQHDPYARRPGYVTGVDGRTDMWTTAVVAGVVTAAAVLFVSGLLHLTEPIAYSAAVVIGLVVWLTMRARRRAADRRAGRSPDAVAEARTRAVAEANGGRRFFVAQNPVVLIVMGCIFLAVGVARTVATGVSGASVLVAVVLAACAGYFIVQGIGTLVVRRRSGDAPHPDAGGVDARGRGDHGAH